jgi:hypothetical protein
MNDRHPGEHEFHRIAWREAHDGISDVAGTSGALRFGVSVPVANCLDDALEHGLGDGLAGFSWWRDHDI